MGRGAGDPVSGGNHVVVRRETAPAQGQDQPWRSRSILKYVETTADKDATGRYMSRYLCGCGREVLAARSTVEGRNHKLSCGCLKVVASRRNASIARSRITAESWRKITIHGMTNTRFYWVWRGMRNRCENPNVKSYKDYGARGIRVCERWQQFELFMADMYPAYCAHLGANVNTTIERIDVDGDYEPSNCTWVTRAEQARNRRPARRST